MRRIIVVSALAATLLVLATTTVAFAKPSPNGPGQPGAPGVSCGAGNAVDQPNGFLTDGFANAEEHYAGSPGTPSALHAHSDHAVSQYDIACFQQTVNH
jgi:hypothetical protein